MRILFSIGRVSAAVLLVTFSGVISFPMISVYRYEKPAELRRSDYPIVEAAVHQYPWSSWISLNDGKSNGIEFAFRKGDNDFLERGMVFVRFYNRYRAKVAGEVTFVIVNNTTGQTSTTKSQGFRMNPESEQEDSGSWDTAPGDNEGPAAWARASISLREIRVKELRFPNY